MVYLSTMVKTDGKMYIMFYYLFDYIKKVKQSPTFQWQPSAGCKQHFCPAATSICCHQRCLICIFVSKTGREQSGCCHPEKQPSVAAGTVAGFMQHI